MKIIQNLKKNWFSNGSIKEDSKDILQFIWGIKSYNDLTNQDCNLYTMNDIDILYDKSKEKYYITIETDHDFKECLEDEKAYVKKLFYALTDWMISIECDTDKRVNILDIFKEGNNIKTGYDSLEELYANFKFLIQGFIEI